MKKNKRGTSTLFLAIILSALILVETTYLAYVADLNRRLTYTRALKEQTEVYLASYDRQLFKTYGIYAFDYNRINSLVFNEILAANGYETGDVMYASGMYSLDTEILRRAVACYYSYRASGVIFQRFSSQIMYLIEQIGQGGVLQELREFVSSPASGLVGRIIDGGADVGVTRYVLFGSWVFGMILREVLVSKHFVHEIAKDGKCGTATLPQCAGAEMDAAVFSTHPSTSDKVG